MNKDTLIAKLTADLYEVRESFANAGKEATRLERRVNELEEVLQLIRLEVGAPQCHERNLVSILHSKIHDVRMANLNNPICMDCGHSEIEHKAPDCICDRTTPDENGCLAHDKENRPCTHSKCTCKKVTHLNDEQA